MYLLLLLHSSRLQTQSIALVLLLSELEMLGQCTCAGIAWTITIGYWVEWTTLLSYLSPWKNVITMFQINVLTNNIYTVSVLSLGNEEHESMLDGPLLMLEWVFENPNGYLAVLPWLCDRVA